MVGAQEMPICLIKSLNKISIEKSFLSVVTLIQHMKAMVNSGNNFIIRNQWVSNLRDCGVLPHTCISQGLIGKAEPLGEIYMIKALLKGFELT